MAQFGYTPLPSGQWTLKMNTSLLDDKNVLDRFKHRWADWRRRRHCYKNHAQWLENYVKHQIQNFFTYESRQKSARAQ